MISQIRSFFILFCTFLTALMSLGNVNLFAQSESDFYNENQLMRDLMIVDKVNQRMAEYFPVTYNNYLQGGYFQMPSARMGEQGEVSFGASYVPPYDNYSLRCQLFSHLEITGNYRVFLGVEDPVLSVHGFGDFADKGANIKWAIIRPQDSDYTLPGLVLGFDDIIGTRSFRAQYIVATQVCPQYDFEASLGFGAQRINGFFGGVLWMPFRKCGYPYLQHLSVGLEYDATHYKYDPNPHGRSQKSCWNPGVKYRLWDCIDFSCNVVRGEKIAASFLPFIILVRPKVSYPR